MQDVSKSVRKITQKAVGTCNGAIIDMASEISYVLERFNHRLTKLENAKCCCKNEVVEKLDSEQLSVHGVSPEILDSAAVIEVPQVTVSESKGKVTGPSGKTKKSKSTSNKK